MYTLIKNKQGLTLVETLIAIAILLMSAVMPMVIYSNSIVSARYASEQITATYLAQEAVELVKYRISTELNNNADTGASDWFDVFTENCRGNGSNVCTINVPDGNICRGLPSACDYYKLYLDGDNLYSHDPSSVSSKFSRTVMFPSNRLQEGTRVSSTVTWESGGESKSVTVEEYITRWR